MSYDPKCHDLAKVVLSDFDDYPTEDAEAKATAALAQAIQDAIEGWIDANCQF